ncbi:phosphoribosylpyrophosphate synthetase [Scheffersomyces xylosifermentans]|uniref:phosphoribosylpyrophosphate synthetase n=1 Tax=Scheffersomyces xylosifermentans TaxID=1304137 RepID=UPI00315DD5B5
MRDLVVLGGSSHPQLTRTICRNLTIEQGVVTSTKFSNGETSIEVQDSVREKDVFIVQSGCGDVNDNFIELLIMIAACKTASARRVTAVLPLFPYSRQPDVPHAASLTGAPSLATKKDHYTFDSAPGTPRPLSRNDTLTGIASENDSYPNAPPTLSLNTGASNGLGLLGKATINNMRPTAIERSQSANRIFTPRSIVTNSASTNIPTVDAYGKTESGYKQWIAQNGTLIANLLMTAGADRLITMDLHDPQFQGFFNIPVDNLYSRPLLKHYILDYIPNYQECVIVSPDSGGAKRAIAVADSLGCSFALIHKERRAKVAKAPPSTNATSTPMTTNPNAILSSSVAGFNSANPSMIATTMLVGDVKDKVCVLIDDLVDTSYTITRAAKLLKDQGATYVYALVTHGVFSGDAINRVNKSAIDKVITTNSVPQIERMRLLGSDKFEVLDVSRILAESIRRIHNGESVSMLFDHGW